MYMVARQDQACIKLYYDTGSAADLFKLVNHVGPVQLQVTINKNLTSTYKQMTIPFYDLKSYKLLAHDGQLAMDVAQPPAMELHDAES